MRAELAAAAKAGDTAAFAKLYEQINKKLYYWALANLGSADDAADTVQDAALKAYSSISELRSPKAFESWIFRILVNIVRAKQKDHAAERENRSAADPAEVTAEPPFGKLELIQGLAKLSAEERQCLTLYGVAGYNSAEIAAITGLKASTVRSHISRGRAKLRKELKGSKEVT